MSNETQQIINKAWNFAHVLRDDGLSYMAYTDQITFLLFLKMAHGQTRSPYNRKPVLPPNLGWESLLKCEGATACSQKNPDGDKHSSVAHPANS